jgi:hypothetical protein
MHQPVDHRCDDVVAKDLSPAPEGLIAGDDHVQHLMIVDGWVKIHPELEGQYSAGSDIPGRRPRKHLRRPIQQR